MGSMTTERGSERLTDECVDRIAQVQIACARAAIERVNGCVVVPGRVPYAAWEIESLRELLERMRGI